MNDFLDKGKEILKILISNGYEAYFIADVVRQIILNQEYDEIEIITTATPSAIKGIFQFAKAEDYADDMIKVSYYGYEFFLSTFKVREKKTRKTVQKAHYSKKLLDDLASRDFTINAIAMSHSEKLTDAHRGYEDIRKKKIRAINKNYDLSPILMLRAIRLVSQTHFSLSGSIRRSIRKYRQHLAQAPHILVVSELKKLFKGKYYKQALEILVSTRLYKHIPELDTSFRYQRKTRYREFSFDEFITISFLINNRISENYINHLEDKDRALQIYKLVSNNPKSNFTTYEILKYGLETCKLANTYSNYLKKTKKKHKKLNKTYKLMIIKNLNDLSFKHKDILALGENISSELAESIQDKIIALILENELANDYDVLKVFAINELKLKEGIIKEVSPSYEYKASHVEASINPLLNPDVDILEKELDYTHLEAAQSEEEMSETLKRQAKIIKDLTEHRLDMLERRINEQDRLLREKDLLYTKLERETRERQIQDDIDSLVHKNMELLKESDYLNNPQKDKAELSRQLHKVYVDYIRDFDNRYMKNDQ